jgi:predicted GIY-YIG superfamily endonuclease
MVVEREFNLLTKGPVTPAKYIYFITNSNRTIITVGITDNILFFAKNLRNSLELFQLGYSNNNRLVYLEEYDNVFAIKERYRELNCWTRAQKEKLIRLYNQEWTDLSEAIIIDSLMNDSHKKNPAMRPGFNYN